MPQEIWNNISGRLSTFLALPAADIFDFGLESNHRKHAAAWRTIFKDETWASHVLNKGLNPFLIGSDLSRLYNEQKPVATSQRSLFLTLHVCDTSSDNHYDTEGTELFFSSLQPHTYEKATAEVSFSNGVVMNIKDILTDGEFVVLNPRRLFSFRRRRLRTSSMHWDDSQCRLRSIVGKDVVGLGGESTNLDSISMICGIDIVRPDGCKHQVIFKEAADMENVIPISTGRPSLNWLNPPRRNGWN